MKTRTFPKFSLTKSIAIVSLGCAITARTAAQSVWSGPPGGDYATAANWTPANIPGDGNNNAAHIGNGTIGSALYNTAGSFTTTGQLLVGAGLDGDGTLVLDGNAGTLRFGGDGYGLAAWIGSTTAVGAATGIVTVNAGTLALGTGLAGSDASINLGVQIGGSGARTGTLNIGGGTVEVGRRVLVAANSTATIGTLNMMSGTLDLIRTGSNAEGDLGMIRLGNGTATLNLDGGTVIFSGFHQSASTVSSKFIYNGTELRVNAAGNLINSGGAATHQIKTGGMIVNTNGFDTAIARNGITNFPGDSGTLKKNGAGKLTFASVSHSYTATEVNAGTVDLDRNDVFGNAAGSQHTLRINSGALVTNGTLVNRGFNALKALELNGGELRVTGTARAIADGPVFKFEAYALKETVTVGGSAPSLISNPGAIANAGINIGNSTGPSSTTFDVADVTSSPAADLVVTAVLKNAYDAAFNPLTSGLIKTGAGTMSLDALNLYTGTTVVNAGTLLLNGSVSGAVVVDGGTLGGTGNLGATDVNAGGTLAPGTSIGTLIFESDLTLGGTSLFEISKTGMTLQSDLANVTAGLLTLGGTLTVLASGDALAQGDSFNLFDAPAFAGGFASYNLPGLGPGLAWDTSNLAVDGTIAVVPEPGAATALLGGLALLLAIRRARK